MIGVDISDRSIKVAEVTDEYNPVLKTLGWSSLSDQVMQRGVIKDVQQVREGLREALANCNPEPVKGLEITASIPEVQSFVKVVEVPVMAEQETDEAVRWAVKRHLPFDLERVYIDWEPLEDQSKPNGQMRPVLVGAAQREVVDPLLAVVSGLEYNVVALELEAQAVMRCLLPREKKDAREIRGVLVIDLGATTTNMMMYDLGGMRFTTSIPFGGDDITLEVAQQLGIAVAQAMELKLRLGVGKESDNNQAMAVLRRAALKLVKRVERAVSAILTQMPGEQAFRIILLTGGGANLPGFTEVFSTVYPGVPVQLGNPWTNINREKYKLSTGDAMHFTTALGLALRQPEYY